ncbi:MAG: T9SS type A sorting domain-containing protein [Vicingaceae bacterium]|nr:T9SS type A sorting domain-containing protein [Vicingaceae bacterium]
MRKITSFITAVIISSTTFYHAQAPGGVSGGGTVEVWLDAAQLNAANGTLLSTFTDASGNGNNATASGSDRPRYYAADANFNNQAVISLDGLGDNMLTGSIPALETNTMSSYVVARANTNHSSVIFRSAYSGGTASGPQYMFGVVKLKNSSRTELQAKRADGLHAKFTTPHNTNVGVYTNVWDGTNSFDGYYNGTSLGASKTNASATPKGHLGVTIGKNISGAAFPFFGQIAELFIFSKKINTAERNILDNYVAAKYGLSIPNDMYAYETTHYHDLIGLGRESDGDNLTAQGTSLLSLSIASLGLGDYVFAAHDNAGYVANSVDIPANVFARYAQVWRADVNGVPGAVDISFDVSNNSLGSNTGYMLLLDNDGVFASGATQIAGTYNSGIVTFSGVNLSSGVYFTLSNNDVTIRSTGVTTDWHLTTTWDCGCIPVQSSKVIVEAGHTVDINSQAALCSDLTIDGTLNINNGDTLYLSNAYINNNTFNTGTGTVSFDGINAQTITGITAFYNLHINNTNGVTNNGIVSVQHWLDVTAGSFATGGNLTLLSNASGTGALKNPNTGTISGNVTVQRYLNEGESWYLLAPAVMGADIEDWNQEFEMQGFTGTEWPTAGYASFFYYDQNNNVSDFNDGYTVPNSTADIMSHQMGFETYVGDDTYATGPRSIDATGTLALGNQHISAPHIANIGITSEDGWTLMANPYAAPIQWRDVVKSGSFDAAYRRKNDGTSALMGWHFVLAPGEAFWVHADPGGATVEFEPADVSATNIDNYNLRLAESENLIVKLTYDGGEDVTEIGFSEIASNERVRGEDAYKLYHADKRKPNISTLVNNEKFLLNVLNSEEDMVLPLLIETVLPENATKQYTLSFENVFIHTQDRKIWLEEIKTNKLYELTDNFELKIALEDNIKTPQYRLIVKSDENATIATNHINDSYVSYTSNGIEIYMNNKEEGYYEFIMYDVMGKLIRQEKVNIASNGKYLLNSNVSEGMYMMHITSSEGTYSSHKIVVSNKN